MVGDGGSIELHASPGGGARPLERDTRRSAYAGVQEIERLPTGDVDPLGPARRALVCRLRSHQAELQEAVFAHVRGVVPDGVTDEDAQLASGLREMIAACVNCGLAGIEQGEQWPGPAPPAVAAQARRAASRGMTLATALRRCAAGSTLLWSIVLGEVVLQDLPDEQRYALLLQALAVMGSLLVCVQAEIGDAHAIEIRRGARSQEQRRAEIVHKLLAGEPVGAGELADLEYELEGVAPRRDRDRRGGRQGRARSGGRARS